MQEQIKKNSFGGLIPSGSSRQINRLHSSSDHRSRKIGRSSSGGPS